MLAEFEIDDGAQFFAPVSTDLVDTLLGQYQNMRGKIEKVAAIFEGDLGGVVHFFIEGNRQVDNSRYSSYSAEKIFGVEGAVAALNAAYWQKALALTDVRDYMPQARREEWDKTIREMTAPEFTDEAVRPTVIGLLGSRQQFFGERVDGVFRKLSRDHVTNVPEGFSKRMILNYVINSYGHVDHNSAGYINDLRCVIAKFMGRDEPKWDATNSAIETAKHRSGQWITLDGGALRLRVYKKGTGHLEVHPDMAYRLNQVLAGMYPMAIPTEFRTKPTKRAKEFPMMSKPLSFSVIDILSRLRQASERENPGDDFRPRYRPINGSLQFDMSDHASADRKEVACILEALGGTLAGKHGTYYQFDYAVGEVIRDIVASGCLPEEKTHQFYPTKEALAEEAVDLAEIGDNDKCCEPSAGMGGIANFMPKDRTRCIEISGLHCSVLKAKGFDTVQADFLNWSAETTERFDRIVMNPPFSSGRALAHLNAAASLINPGGKLVAILPGSMRNTEVLPGFDITWSGLRSDQFDGTGVNVAILTATRN